MTIHRCDRCEKEVRLSEPFFEFEIGNLHNVFAIKNHIELCENCKEEFYEWVRQRRMEVRCGM